MNDEELKIVVANLAAAAASQADSIRELRILPRARLKPLEG
jgi:hypothetical protein